MSNTSIKERLTALLSGLVSMRQETTETKEAIAEQVASITESEDSEPIASYGVRRPTRYCNEPLTEENRYWRTVCECKASTPKEQQCEHYTTVVCPPARKCNEPLTEENRDWETWCTCWYHTPKDQQCEYFKTVVCAPIRMCHEPITDDNRDYDEMCLCTYNTPDEYMCDSALSYRYGGRSYVPESGD